MPVVVTPVQTINVRLNGPTPQKVASISQFVGASDLGPAVNAATAEANSAYYLANSVYGVANDAYEIAVTANTEAIISYNMANGAFTLANTLSTSIDGGAF